jgi:hypothetical protein
MADTGTGPLTGEFVQMAYITNDFDAALRLFADRHGVSKFLELRDYTMETMPRQDAKVDIGLAWAGGVQIEVIRPISGADQTYRAILSGGPAFEMRFHHEAQKLPSLDALEAARAEAKARGFPIVVDGKDAAGVTYFYADCRATIGHHIEYIYYPEAIWTQVDAAIPRN